MKKNCLLSLLFLLGVLSAHAGEWIRINQLGYLPQSIKVAVFMSEESTEIQNFQIFNAQTNKLECTVSVVKSTGEWGKMKSTCRLDFSDFEQPGIYYLKAGNAVSPHFPIDTKVYDGTADFLLKYMPTATYVYMLSTLCGMIYDVTIMSMTTIFQEWVISASLLSHVF